MLAHHAKVSEGEISAVTVDPGKTHDIASLKQKNRHIGRSFHSFEKIPFCLYLPVVEDGLKGLLSLALLCDAE